MDEGAVTPVNVDWMLLPPFPPFPPAVTVTVWVTVEGAGSVQTTLTTCVWKPADARASRAEIVEIVENFILERKLNN
jgi:hypothetical protein